MAVDLAQNPGMYIAVIFLELIFLAIVIVIIWGKVRVEAIPSFHEGFREYGMRFPESDRMGSDEIKKVGVEVVIGSIMGVGMLFVAEIMAFAGYEITKALFGEEFYEQASAGSVNTSPPSLEHIQVVLVVILMFLVVASCEELFFRGMLISEIRGPLWIKVILSTVIFSIYHVPPFIVPWQTTTTFLLYYFSLGIVLALLFRWRGNLIAPIVAHGLFNAIHIVIAYW